MKREIAAALSRALVEGAAPAGRIFRLCSAAADVQVGLAAFA